MFSKKRYLYLSNEELRILLKNSLIQQGRYTDCVDKLILKVTKHPIAHTAS